MLQVLNRMSNKGGAPNAVERKACHAARDAFFQCLDRCDNNENKCLAEKRTFDGTCPKSWVKYFGRRREFKKYSEKLDQGFIPADEDDE